MESTTTNSMKSAALLSTSTVVVGTRIHWSNHTQADQRIQVDKTLAQVHAFCARAVTYADSILIAVGLPQALAPSSFASATTESAFVASVREFLTRLQSETRGGVSVVNGDADADADGATTRIVRVEIIPMLHWGSFVPALNAIISTAATQFQSAMLLLLQSLEIEVDAAGVQFLKTRFEFGKDLVVGAALPGHSFQPSTKIDAELELNGLTTPWNTLAIWDLTRLAMVGFPLIGDGLRVDPSGSTSAAGVEEVSTILLYQQLFPSASTAKVVKVPGIAWQVDNFESEERRTWQEKKMTSKLQRAERQMEHFGLARGKVLHLQ